MFDTLNITCTLVDLVSIVRSAKFDTPLTTVRIEFTYVYETETSKTLLCSRSNLAPTVRQTQLGFGI